MSTNYEPFEFAAGAFSSGVMHAVSTAVIIMEISHTDGLNLSVSVAILAAYLTAKKLTENILTSNLSRLKKLPKAAYDIPAWEVMKDVTEMGVLSADSTYEDALVLLQRSDMEPVFPIVDSLENRFLLATVTRSRLAYAVSHIRLTPVGLRQPSRSHSDSCNFAAFLDYTSIRHSYHCEGNRLQLGLSRSIAVIRRSYRTMDSTSRDDDSEMQQWSFDELPLQLLQSPINFASRRGGKVMNWVTNEE